jgi:hypothetical protein
MPKKLGKALNNQSFVELEQKVIQKVKNLNEEKRKIIEMSTKLICEIGQQCSEDICKFDREIATLLNLVKENYYDDEQQQQIIGILQPVPEPIPFPAAKMTFQEFRRTTSQNLNNYDDDV